MTFWKIYIFFCNYFFCISRMRGICLWVFVYACVSVYAFALCDAATDFRYSRCIFLCFSNKLFLILFNFSLQYRSISDVWNVNVDNEAFYWKASFWSDKITKKWKRKRKITAFFIEFLFVLIWFGVFWFNNKWNRSESTIYVRKKTKGLVQCYN